MKILIHNWDQPDECGMSPTVTEDLSGRASVTSHIPGYYTIPGFPFP